MGGFHHCPIVFKFLLLLSHSYLFYVTLQPGACNLATDARRPVKILPHMYNNGLHSASGEGMMWTAADKGFPANTQTENEKPHQFFFSSPQQNGFLQVVYLVN